MGRIPQRGTEFSNTQGRQNTWEKHHSERGDRDQHYLLGPGVSLGKRDTSFSKIGERGQRLRKQVEKKNVPDGFHGPRNAQSKTIWWKGKRTANEGNLRRVDGVCMHTCSVASVMSNFFATLWAVAYQTPLSMRFSRQEYWSELPHPPPGDLPDPGLKPVSPALQVDS